METAALGQGLDLSKEPGKRTALRGCWGSRYFPSEAELPWDRMLEGQLAKVESTVSSRARLPSKPRPGSASCCLPSAHRLPRRQGPLPVTPGPKLEVSRASLSLAAPAPMPAPDPTLPHLPSTCQALEMGHQPVCFLPLVSHPRRGVPDVARAVTSPPATNVEDTANQHPGGGSLQNPVLASAS